MRVAVVGGGWSGLSAAVHATALGHRVTLFEMAPRLGGRAREVEARNLRLDNGQHILIGAYRATIALMRQVGVPVEEALHRTPLALVGPDGRGLVLPRGAPRVAFVRAVLGRTGWSWQERIALLRVALGWARAGFACEPSRTVSEIAAPLSDAVRTGLVDPLCVAALNTPASQASASVFLRVLRDALFSGPGSADLLLPKCSLSALLPDPAAHWLASHGCRLRLGARVQRLDAAGSGSWVVNGERFDSAILAASASETARLVGSLQPAWTQAADCLRHEPIVTVYATSPGARLGAPMIALESNAEAPAQFVFDLQALRGVPGLLALVVSGAGAWVERGLQATADAALSQARRALAGHLTGSVQLVKVLVEKRATFACVPGLERPPATIAPGLLAAGDYIDGPYPATLEGAVRSGLAAAAALSVHDAKSAP